MIPGNDRYIPTRDDQWTLKANLYHHQLLNPNVDFQEAKENPLSDEGRRFRACFGINANVLSQGIFRQTSQARPPISPWRPPVTERIVPIMKIYWQEQQAWEKVAKVPQLDHISTSPIRTLDAPNLLDDFYLHLLDARQTKKDDMVAVGLGQRVFTWKESNNEIREVGNLNEAEQDYFSCVRWMQNKDRLFYADSTGMCSVKDLVQGTNTFRKSVSSSPMRVVCMENENPSTFLVGTRTGAILRFDTRTQDEPKRIGAFEQEVCSLALHPEGHLLASGGNDNVVKIWDLRSTGRVSEMREHTAAIKALAWAPWDHTLLFSGGGTADKKIKALQVVDRTWQEDISIRTIATEVRMHSQVTGFHVCEHARTFVSTHGFSENAIGVWSYRNKAFNLLKKLTGHTSRILHSAIMGDGVTLVTASADETLRFWTVFEKKRCFEVVEKMDITKLPLLR